MPFTCYEKFQPGYEELSISNEFKIISIMQLKYPEVIFDNSWHYCLSKSNLHNLAVSQKWLLKMISNKPKLYPSDTLYQENKILDIIHFFNWLKLHLLKITEMLDGNTRQQNRPRDPKLGKLICQRCRNFIGAIVFN